MITSEVHSVSYTKRFSETISSFSGLAKILIWLGLEKEQKAFVFTMQFSHAVALMNIQGHILF